MILSRRWTAVLLLLILLLAAFLRLWELESLPPGLYHDEAYNGLDALSMVQGKMFPQFYEGWELYAQDAHGDNPPPPTRFPVFFEGNYGREPLHVYLMAFSIRLFGPTPFAVRMVPAVSGVLAVLLTYFAAQTLLVVRQKDASMGPYADWIPLLAAFFLAILLPAVHFSRFGLRAMVFVPIEMLTVIFFWHGYNLSQNTPLPGDTHTAHRATLSFLAAGFCLGLGIYIYAAARLFPLLFVAFILFWVWRDWSGLRQNWLNVGGMALVGLLTALPLLLFFWRYPYFFVFRIAYVANKGLGTVEDQPLLTWLLNVGRVVRGLYWQGETHLRHNLPGRPYLDPVQAVLFTLGLLQTVRQKLNPRTVFLLLWLLVMLLPTILSGDAPHFGRMTGAAGVVAILVAVGFVWLGAVIGNQLSVISKRSQKAFHFSLFTFHFLLLTASLAFTIRDYFGRYASHPQLAADFYLPDWQLGQFAAGQPEETAVYLTPTQEEMATIYFALEGNAGKLRSFAGSGSLVPLGPPQTPTLYLIRPSQTQRLTALQEQLPDLIVGEEQNNFIPALLPADAQRPQPQHLVSHSWAGQIQLLGWSKMKYDQTLVVTLFWQAEANMARNYTAFVHLLNENGELMAQLDRQPDGYLTSDWRVGEIIVDRYVVNLPQEAAVDAYKLQTGWYFLPSLESLGEPFVLSE